MMTAFWGSRLVVSSAVTGRSTSHSTCLRVTFNRHSACATPSPAQATTLRPAMLTRSRLSPMPPRLREAMGQYEVTDTSPLSRAARAGQGAGFMGKLYIFGEAVKHPQLLWLVVAGVLNSVVSVYYYLRVIVVMYMKQPEEGGYDSADTVAVSAAAVLAGLVLLLGVMPDSVHRAAQEIFRQITF